MYTTMTNNIQTNEASGVNTGGSSTFGSHCDNVEDSNSKTLELPDVIELMKDEDPSVVCKSVMIVYQMSDDETTRQTIIQSQEMMQTLTTLMTNSSNEEILKGCAAIFHNLSPNLPGLQAIYQSGGVLALIRLLDSEVESIVNYSVTTIHNLLLHHEASKHAVRTSGGLAKLIQLLDRQNCKFLAIVADCLQILAFCNQDGKRIIMENNGPAALVSILNKFTYEKLLWTTTRVLKVLSVCPKNKKKIVNFGGLQALAYVLPNTTSTRLILNCLWTLRNLSNAATQQTNLKPLLKNLITLSKSDDINIVTCSVCILSNLTCNNEESKQIVYEEKGIVALSNVLIKANDRQEIIAPTLCTLRHMTSRHSFAEQCQEDLRIHCTLSRIVQLLRLPSWPIIKAVIGLIRNLAFFDANLQPLQDQNIIQRLYHFLAKSYQKIKHVNSNQIDQDVFSMNLSSSENETRWTLTATVPISNQIESRSGTPESSGPRGEESKERSEGKRSKVNADIVDGVHMNEIVEGTLGTLRVLAKKNRNLILRLVPDVIPICVDLLFNPIENILISAAGCLNELAFDPDGAEQIELEGGLAQLTNLMNSSNDDISLIAEAILFKINGHKQNLSSSSSSSSSFFYSQTMQQQLQQSQLKLYQEQPQQKRPRLMLQLQPYMEEQTFTQQQHSQPEELPTTLTMANQIGIFQQFEPEV